MTAYGEAISVFIAQGATHYRTVAAANLEIAEKLLAARKGQAQ